MRDVLRKNHWLVLSTANKKGAPQSSVVVYASDGSAIYILTGRETLKTRNIHENKHVAVTIPFRKNLLHRIMKRIPPAEVHFRGKAEILSYDNAEAKRIYQKTLNYETPSDLEQISVWIKIKPSSKIACYGVGVGLLKMRKPEKARRIVQLSEHVHS